MRSALLACLLTCFACSSNAPPGGGYVGGYVLPDATSVPDTGGAACTPGLTQLCLCAPKTEGVQVCRDDGKGWHACSCGGSSGDGGTTADHGGGDGSPSADATGSDKDGGSDGSPATPDDGAGVADGAGADDASDGSAGDDSTADAADDDWANYFDDATDDDAGPPPDSGPAGFDCIARAKIIYVVTEQKVLLSFDPETMKMKVVGTLNCPAQLGASPFSMAVDHDATAWVLYQSPFGGGGSLFQVSTLDASCQATSFQPGQAGLDLFGMGFSSNGIGSANESLYVAGAGYTSFQTTANTLATIAFPSLQLSPIAKINVAGGADLTGNGVGQLFGFFPATSPPSVREIDKATGMTGKTWTLPSSSFSNTKAWAFAQWGGTFYLFFQSVSDPSTNVWALDSKTGGVKVVLPNIGFTVTGAGVSSCAPSSKP